MELNRSNKKGQPNVFSFIQDWLLKVPATNMHQEFRARILTITAIVLLCSLVLGIAVTLILPTPQVITSRLCLVLWSCIAILIVALNRQNQYQIAAVSVICLLIVAPLSIVIVSQKHFTLLGLMAMITSISVPLTLALLPGRRNSLFAVGISAIAFLVIPAFAADYSFLQIFEFSLGIAGIGLLWVMYDHFRARLEQEPLNALREKVEALQSTEATLRQTNQRLTRELQDSAIEIQATVDEFLLAKEETEQAKNAAERANNVKSAFLASMSHELRTPLNAIINYSKFVAKGSMGPVNEEQAETLHEVVDSAKHLLNLINDVLDMSKIESGSLTLFIEDNIDLRPVVESVMSIGKGLLGEKQVALESQIAPDLPTIKGDRQRILQIFLNIMSNACKFTEQGHIKLEVAHAQNEVIVSIEDTGSGISPEDHEKVFEAFKQTDTGLRQVGGTGLGMPISKNLAESHGGRLWLESEVGKGTTFRVALPVNSATLTAT
jgi:signal transduction histidine kinase